MKKVIFTLLMLAGAGLFDTYAQSDPNFETVRAKKHFINTSTNTNTAEYIGAANNGSDYGISMYTMGAERLRLYDRFYSYVPMSIVNDFNVTGTADFKEIRLGANSTTRESNAGFIAYKKFSDGLDIVGAGNTQAERKITFWSEGGVTFKAPGNASSMLIDADGTILLGSNIAKFQGAKAVASRDSFNVWIDKGVIAADFAIENPSNWSDYVFAKDYSLRSLKDVSSFIKKNKHLPDVPSEEEIKKNGYTVHDMNTRLLKKIEELTLYVIEQDKKIEDLNSSKQQYDLLQKEVAGIKKMLNYKMD